MKIDLSCPIELFNYALPTEEQPYCTLTFFNLDRKTVASVQVMLTLLDAEGNQLSRMLERAVDLQGESKQLFDAHIACDVPGVQQLELYVEKVWFDDATVWRKASASSYQEYTPNHLPPNALRDHLRFVAGADAVGFPADQGPLWVCVCGRPNASAEIICRRCGRDKLVIFEQCNPVAVQQAVEQRDRTQQELAKRARAEEAMREKEQRALEIRKRSKRRSRILALVAAVALVVGAFAFVVYGLPALRYWRAQSLLSGGNPTEARAAFAALGSYRDAAQQVRDSDFAIAMQYLGSSDAAVREEGFRLLDAMKDYPVARLQAQKARYIEAGDAIKRGDYLTAEALLRKVGEYAEAKDMLNECVYQIALQEAENTQYGSAAQRFASLGNYRDAATRATVSVYRQAEQAFGKGDFMQAASLYTSIPTYEDAVARARESVYQQALALENEGKFEEAIAQYEKLGGYKDAADRAKLSVYTPAIAAMQAERYDEAAKLFASIPGYEDADDLAKECVYLPASKLYEAKEWQKAIELLATIPAYKDADQLASSAAYTLAQQQADSGDLAKAAEAFAAIGTFEDASDKALEIRYQLATAEYDAKRYEQAMPMFAALGTYQDATKRVKDCQYQLALGQKEAGNWQEARKAFLALEGFGDAAKQADLCLYSEAEGLRDAGKFEDAAALFQQLGKFQDAAAQVSACKYKLAEQYETEGKLEAAGKLFEALGSYSNAKERSDLAYDTWLSGIQTTVNRAMDAQNYGEVITTLEKENVPLSSLPKQYEGLEETYREAHLAYAKQLIASGNSLSAYPYLKKVSGMKDASKLLKQYVFMILGSWDSAEGSKAEFKEDGSCVIDGQALYYNVDGYAVMIGDTPRPLKRTHSIILLNEKNLTLKNLADDVTVKYTRVGTVE